MLKETNTPTRPRIEPGSPDPESDALTIRPVRPPIKGITCLLDVLSILESIVTDHLQDLCLKNEVILDRISNLKDKTKGCIESGREGANEKIMNTLSQEGQLTRKNETVNKQILSVFEDQFNHFIALLETGSKEEIFIMQTALQSDILKYEPLFEELKEPFNKTFSVTGQPNVDVLLKEINVTKQLKVRENIATEKLLFDDQQAVFIGEVDLSILNTSQIVGIEILPDGEILLCDKTTNKVYMLCKSYTLLGTFKLNGQPSCMTATSSKSIVVSLPAQSSLQFAEIDEKLNFAKGQTKKTKVPCLFIAQYAKELIAIMDDTLCKCFVKMDTIGNITSQIYVNKENDLKTILFMTVCSVNDIIYITEKTRGCVGISMTDGVIVFKYKAKQFPCYTGLTTHPTGRLFIAESDAVKIIAIHPDDGKHVDRTEEVNDFISAEGLRPSCIAYSSVHRILAVHTQSNRNRVRVFKIF